MKNIILLIIAAVALTGCAAELPGPEGLKVETKFQPFVDAFQAKSSKEGTPIVIHDLTIRIDDTMPGPPPRNTGGFWTLGICTTGGGGNPTITVNPYFWNNNYYTNADREELLFHEMGHCVLGRGHTSETAISVDGYAIPVSIMNPYHLGSYRYGVNYNYYMQELFGLSPSRTLYAFGVTQFNNIYASLTGSKEPAPQIKMYKVTANAQGDIEHDEDGDDTPPSIEGMACGDEN